jgi:hypothetical protein
MRGYPDFNFPAFRKAAIELRNHGHEVFSPHERDERNGFDSSGMAGTSEELLKSKFSLREALADDLNWICRHADTVVVLDGWEESAGANAEANAAWALGIPVYEFTNFCYFSPKEEIKP